MHCVSSGCRNRVTISKRFAANLFQIVMLRGCNSTPGLTNSCAHWGSPPVPSQPMPVCRRAEPAPGGFRTFLKGVAGGPVCRGGLTRAECNGRKEKSEKEDFDGRFALHGKLSPIQKSLLPVAERVPNHQPPRREGCRYKGAWIAAGLPTEEEPRLCNSS